MIKIREAKLLDFFKIYFFCKNRSKKSKELFNPRVLKRPYWFIPFFIFNKITSYIALNGRKLVGIIYITHLKNNVLGMGVKDNYQGQGIGKKLMSIILKNQKDIYLTVREDNFPAKKLYENFGFKVIHKIIAMRKKNK